MNKGEHHAVACDERWVSQHDTNQRHQAQFAELFARVNKLEVRFAGLAAIGGFLGSLLGKLF